MRFKNMKLKLRHLFTINSDFFDPFFGIETLNLKFSRSMRYIGYRVVSKVPSEDIQTITWSLENHVSLNAWALSQIRHCHWLIHEQYFECVCLRRWQLDFHQSKLSFLWKSNPNSFSISNLAIYRLVHASNTLQSRQRFDGAFHSLVHLNSNVILCPEKIMGKWLVGSRMDGREPICTAIFEQN